MPPEVLIFSLIRLAMFVLFGVFAVLGVQLWLRRRDNSSNRIGRDEFDSLADAVDSLHEQTALLREEFQDLHERVDFAERVLSGGSTRHAFEEPADTPV